MLNIKKFLLAIGLIPKSTSQIDSKGELEVIDSTGKLQYHNGTSVSPVVTESHSAILTNKEINADNNTITNIDDNDIKANAGIDASKIANGTVSNSEFQQLDGLTSPAVGTTQSQILTNKTIDADQNTITNIENADIKVGAAIDVTKIANGSVSNSEFQQLDGLTSPAVGTTQAQTLTNKTIDADQNTITNIENADIKANAAIDATKIANGSVSNTEFQHLDGVTSSIQTQLNDKAEDSNLSAHVSASSDVHGLTDGASVVGTTSTQPLTNKSISTSALTAFLGEESQNNSQSGTAVTLTGVTKPIVRLTNASLVSVTGIAALTSLSHGGVITIINTTANEIAILNDVGTASERILTGIDDDIDLAPNAALFLKYDVTTAKWRVIGGTGAGNTIVKAVAGENLATRDAVYISVGAADGGRTEGSAYKIQTNDNNRVEFIGFVKEAVTAGQTAKIIISGTIKGFTSLNRGKMYYCSTTTSGLIDDNVFVSKSDWAIPVGIALTTSVLVINPMASADKVREEVTTFSILNNQSSAQDVSGLSFDPVIESSFLIDYRLFRSTSTTSVARHGRLRGVYNAGTATWSMSEDFAGDDAGVNFTVTSGGQIQYTSSNLSGTGYVGTLEYNSVKSTYLRENSLLQQDGDLITRLSGVNQRLARGTDGQILNATSSGIAWTSKVRIAGGATDTIMELRPSGTGTTSLEIGQGGSGNRTSLIDLVSDNTNTDFGMRIAKYAGVNGGGEVRARGTGGLSIVAQDAAPVAIFTNNTERVRVTSTGSLESYVRSVHSGSQNTVIATATGSLGAIEVLGAGGATAAYMTFHRPSLYATYFGLDTDNVFKVGGWSAGAVAQPLLYAGTTNAPGTAPTYACRAWVNFDGTTPTPSTIRGSGNVSSITRNATGDYTVNFTTAMTDTNYSTFVGTNSILAGNTQMAGEHSATIAGAVTSRLTSSIRVGVGTGGGVQNYSNVNVIVFR